MKRIVRGNDFALRIPVMKIVNGERVAFPLPGCTDIKVNVVNQYRRIALSYTIDVSEDNVLLARVEGDRVAVGTYALEVKGKLFGNDWRSNEYEQFQLVDNNAAGDTVFEPHEGEDSVEMDTALVVLAPSVELGNLIKDAEETIADTKDALKGVETKMGDIEQRADTAIGAATTAAERANTAAETAEQTNTAVETAEKERDAAEQERKTAEEQRKSQMQSNAEAERARAVAEQHRVEAEKRRASEETMRAEAEDTRKTKEADRIAGETSREKQENSRVAAEQTRDSQEKQRKLDEAQRDDAEVKRADAENTRKRMEADRANAEADRVAAEKARAAAETKRAAAETKRENDFSVKVAEVDTAVNNAKTATAEAETCNVTMQGSTISVTDRHGKTKSVDVVNTDEEVTVTITSSVESINVGGININVFLNNGKTPQTYTTNTEGKATFTIARGNYYQVTFPEYGNVQPIAPVGYTAVLGSRNINVEYLPYDEDSMEKVIITATKYVENVGTAWEGIPVIVTVDRKDTTYQTDAKGQVTVFVPYKKEYTVVINDQDGYNVSFNKNSRTYTANVPKRLIDYRFYQFKAGIFVVDENKNEYYIEDWVAAGRNADDAVAIKVADASLSINHGTFCIRTSDIKNVKKLIKTSWCTQELQFNSIALNGNNVNDANYYNGESSSYLIRQEAQERSLSVLAFDYAYGQIFTIGGEELHGFLMSIGQEYVHVANIGIIKQVLETLYGETVSTGYYNFVMNNIRWTSTQLTATSAWNFSSSASDYYKSYSIVVLPVFAC